MKNDKSRFKNLFILFSAALLFSTVIFVFRAVADDAIPADGLTARQIVDRYDTRPIGSDESTELWMALIDGRGDTRYRRIVRFRKSYQDHKEVIMKFTYPEDIRDTGFYNKELPDEKYDVQYLYLPAVKKLRKISSANKEQRWVGSDFFYEDIQEVKLDEWEYNRLPDDEFDGVPCYVIEWLPTKDTDTVYGREVAWYRKADFTWARVDYYDKKGRLWKRATATDLRNNQGIMIAWKITMDDLLSDHRTELYRRWVIFNGDLPEDYFSTRNIEKSIDGFSYPNGLWGLINEKSGYDDNIRG